jgi:hypothetical protein
MCAADHGEDSEELWSLFSGHQHCIPPQVISAADIRSSVSVDGILVIEMPSRLKVKSVLPLSKWKVTITFMDGQKSPLTVVFKASRAISDQRQKCEVDLGKSGQIAFSAAQAGKLGLTIVASNVMGDSASSNIAIVAANNVPARRSSKAAAEGNESDARSQGTKQGSVGKSSVR